MFGYGHKLGGVRNGKRVKLNHILDFQIEKATLEFALICIPLLYRRIQKSLFLTFSTISSIYCPE